MQKFRALANVNDYFSIWVLVILYNALLHKCKFCQARCVGLLKRITMKFSLPFLDTPSSFYKFWKFELFSAI
jgi:hypothetical protein